MSEAVKVGDLISLDSGVPLFSYKENILGYLNGETSMWRSTQGTSIYILLEIIKDPTLANSEEAEFPADIMKLFSLKDKKISYISSLSKKEKFCGGYSVTG